MKAAAITSTLLNRLSKKVFRYLKGVEVACVCIDHIVVIISNESGNRFHCGRESRVRNRDGEGEKGQRDEDGEEKGKMKAIDEVIRSQIKG